MKKCSGLAVLLGLIGLLVMAACGRHDTAGAKKAIEGRLNTTPFQNFHVGKIRLDQPDLEYLRRAEAQGLVTIREIPQEYWDSFLARTQAMGTPFEVTATPKLLAIAKPADGTTAYGGNVVLSVKIGEIAVEEILTDEKYRGTLASPGEEHRLVLGVAKMKPTAAAHVLGTTLASLEGFRYKFRCVVRYSKFKKEWEVAAIDTGSIGTDERWGSENVK